ncbi:MAG: sugar transferase [Terracidiphilus sp.]
MNSPPASRWSLSAGKRFCDVAGAFLVLGFFCLPMLAIALLIRLSSAGPAIFVQKRVGRGGKRFLIYKFRTMAAATPGPGLTRDGDSRITPLGRILRRLKLDELPQFWNVLRGDMSLIGPRPKLPRYSAIRNMPFRPGITGAATLAFRNEEEALRPIHPALLDDYYNRHIRPLKAGIDLNYMAQATFLSDVRILAATVLACILPDADQLNPLADAGLLESSSGSPAPHRFSSNRGYEEA